MAVLVSLRSLHRGKIEYDDASPNVPWALNGSPLHTTGDATYARCLTLAGAESLYQNSVASLNVDDGFVAANFATTSSAKQSIIGASHTTSATPSLLEIWIDAGKIRAKLQRNGVLIWQIASTSSAFADGTWRRLAISGGSDGPKMWTNGSETAISYESGTASDTEWFSNLFGVTFPVNRITVGAVRLSGVNVEPFIGKLRHVVISDDVPTSSVMLTDYLDNQQGYDIIPLPGQSNQIIRYGPIDSTLDATDIRIQQWGRFSPNANKIFLAADPLDHIGGTADTVGLGLSIAKEWIRRRLEPGRRVLLVPVAEGNTGFRNDDWNVSYTNNYSGMLTRTQLAMATSNNNRLVGVCWQLGENDAAGNTAQRNAFTAEFREMTAAFRAEFPGESFPVTLGTMPQEWVVTDAGYQIVQDQILAIEDTVPNTILIDLRDLPSEPTELIHYSAASARIAGTRHGAALSLYWEDPGNFTLLQRSTAILKDTSETLPAAIGDIEPSGLTEEQQAVLNQVLNIPRADEELEPGGAVRKVNQRNQFIDETIQKKVS
ncbi:sialate O-acetylesterase [Aureliella helgolandensis]|uniref:Sialate O-acetylesterase domain-containing protein n=1 Tax=Aureliella helgolandensis TaxID=2527968 RepID=A0A518G4G1_9BACT|nr:sialate O-acetylesterase [Aureliella helgolandensis]QDV23440.1 hypothetical protein Q31a_17380 [Aureliella helgolandensis]